MNRNRRLLLFFIAIISSAGLVLSGSLYTPSAAADMGSPCVAEGKLTKEIAPEAQLESISCFFKKYEGLEALHVKVAVKNKSDKPQRFKVNIFMDNGKAVGGLLPRTTKKGLIEPGKSQSFVYPVTGMTEKAGEITLIIKTMSQ